ncbi:MAG TPA: dihydroorotase [Phycisphaerae bacterium]|nr:dihydroorotase [Phycisphaerae bacterium]HOI54712.1 dihydroorotase [Phycisphaerae bacterium]
MESILIKGGRVVDPANGVDTESDVLIEAGRIARLGRGLDAPSGSRTIDAAGCVVAPGLIDMHVHFREPGSEHVETIPSGSRAAVAGGFTTVCAMPNTDPCVDNEGAVTFVIRRSKAAALAHVLPIGAITVGRQGEQMAEMGQMVRAGAVAFSDDGSSVADSGLLRRCMTYGKIFGKPFISHAEDKSLAGTGVMHAGKVSAWLGLPGIAAAAEEVIVERDIRLASMSGAKLHIAHTSTAGSVEIIRRAKAAGVAVTAEVTPHHLALTDECCRGFDSKFKMSPPLRTAADIAALKQGLKDGTIDCIASDHAPHEQEEKEVEFAFAPFGVIGLESTVPVVIRELIDTGVLTWPELIAAMSLKPARVLGLDRGTLAVGAVADVTVIDPGLAWTIDAARFESKSRNCPFDGWQVRGRAVATIVAGQVKYRLG